jgi:hypothetical protein
MTAPDTVPARFSVRAALGLWLVVLRNRPVAFASVAVLATIVQTLFMVLQGYFLSVMGNAALSAEGNMGTLSPAYFQASALSTLAALAAFAVWIALEVVWLRLFNAEARPWAVSWGQFGRLLGAFLIVMALFIVAYLVFLIVAVAIAVSAFAAGFELPETLGFTVFAFGVGAAYIVSLLVIGLVMVRLSALPALAIIHRRVDLAAAWRTTRGAYWRTVSAWGAIYLLYGLLLAALVFAGRAWPGLISAYWEMFEISVLPPLDDGTILDPNTAFAGLFDTSPSIAWVWFDSLLVALAAAIYAITARGIGVMLAWRAPAPANAPAQSSGA